MAETDAWPALPLEAWQDTRDTLHMWTQVVGKVRLARAPMVNHWWQVPLYVSARGLTTTAVPDGARSFEVEFDFVEHRLHVRASDGAARSLPLEPRSVADFHREFMELLDGMGLATRIWPVPVEVEDPVPFAQDHRHASYDPEQAHRFWHVLVQADRVLEDFRARFTGKCSPVHFFWGSFDLAVTRFSGRPAPPREGADRVTRLAYSHEVSSAGFWPGGGPVPEPVFYAYMAPEPAGYRDAPVRPEAAYYHRDLGEFLLPYDAVRRADSPDRALLDFLQSSYDAGADLAGWDRAALEWDPAGVP